MTRVRLGGDAERDANLSLHVSKHADQRLGVRGRRVDLGARCRPQREGDRGDEVGFAQAAHLLLLVGGLEGPEAGTRRGLARFLRPPRLPPASTPASPSAPASRLTGFRVRVRVRTARRLH